MNNFTKYAIYALSIFLAYKLFTSKSESIDTEAIENTENMKANEVRAGLAQIVNEYGQSYAENVERVLRWETAHFKSRQWIKGSTAGMEAVKGENKFPYGWLSLKRFTDEKGIDSSKFSTYKMIENNTGIEKTFIKFPDAYIFTLFLAWFIKNIRNNRFGYWFSLNDENAKKYEEKIAKVKPRIVNELI